MGFTNIEFEILTKKHGKWASWAIWEYSSVRIQEKSTSIIQSNLADLNSENILIGLNISKPVEIWGNFRGGKHDRKLKYAFNDSPIRGAYMTDLFRIEMKESTNLARFIKCNPNIVEENVSRFIDEMRDLRINDETRFIILGKEQSILGKYFRLEFHKYFKKNPIIYHRHYSSRGTDKEWVESIWKSLGIDLNYEVVKNNYNS